MTRKMVFGSSNELVEPASDALLPLILCNTALYQVSHAKEARQL
jgi:hypothetical protein